MRARRISGLVGTGLLVAACLPPRSSEPKPVTKAGSRAPADSLAAPTEVSFETDVLPILESRCQPCHFEGGQVYERYPFDDPRTIRTLGTALFTRIEDDAEKDVIRAFLDPTDVGP